MISSKAQILGWFEDEMCKLTGQDASKLEILRKLIQAPDDLQALFLALNNLGPVLESALEVCKSSNYDHELIEDIGTSIEVAQKLIAEEPKFAQKAIFDKLFAQVGEKAKTSAHGKIGTNPLYACLLYKPSDTTLRLRYDHLLAQVILATQIISASNPEDIDRLKKTFLDVRKLSDLKHAIQLQIIPIGSVSQQEFLKTTQHPQAGNKVRSAGNILAKALKGFKKKRVKHTPDEPSKPSPKKRLEDLEDTDSLSRLWTGDDYASQGVLTDKDNDEFVKHGGPRNEYEGGQDNVPVPAADERGYSGPTLRELSFQAKQSSNRIALHNQSSHLAWNALNQFDISILFRFLSGEITSTSSSQEAKLIRVLLCLMFWASIHIERAFALPAFLSTQRMESSLEGIYWMDGKSPRIRLDSPGPPLEEESILSASKSAYPVKYFSHIPLPSFACNVMTYEASRIFKTGKLSAFLSEDFGKERETVTEELKKLIRLELGSLNRQFGCRLSMGRISQFLLSSLADEEGEDLPSAKLFFGSLDNVSDTRLHYTCAPVQRMEKSYRRICSNLLSDIGRLNTFPDKNLTNDDCYLGTPFCPQRGAVQQLAQKLKDAIDQSRASIWTLKNIRNFHNSFAIYTTCFISFATSYRAVRDPSFEEEHILFDSGMGVISDKDDQSYYHSRLVWIPDDCLEQIRNYRRHLQNLFDYFGHLSPALFELFTNHGQPGRPLNLFFIPRGNSDLITLGPGKLGKELEKTFHYDLPVNANRHYMKTELLASGCPSDVIEAELGHWAHGQEPWNRFSNFHPLDFKEQLQQHLPQILRRDGWVPLKGLDQ